ncbi:major facilitator superfamily domain-containing protein [Gongronella butleri]|nr:major facilitator superfamily domain-containing protein [Gongronella butleri]
MGFLQDYYKTPMMQIVLLGLVCLCCPGMFNALSGLGAGGSMSSNITLVAATNGALYACFAVVGIFAGSVCNMFGVKWTIFIGAIGYPVYSSALWVFDVLGVSGYVIASGAILGCCAGLFWSAQGCIMMSYPTEDKKGMYVGIFWSLFNIGGVLGSLIALVLNLQNDAGGVSTATYTAFVIIMLVGVFMSLTLAPPSMITKDDGTPVVISAAASWKDELAGIAAVWKEWRMLALIPAFLASNWFYSYQFHVNAVYFDAPTRALNGLCYWLFQIFGSILIGMQLDYSGMRRRTRGIIGGVINLVMMAAIWAGGIAFQTTFDNNHANPIGWASPGFGGPFVLYIFYGFSDAVFQSYMYWLMGATSNDPRVLSRYAGFYKALQSAGAAASYGIDAANTYLLWECLACMIVLFVAFPGIFLVASKVTDTNLDPVEGAADAVFYDEKAQKEKAETFA